MRWLAVILSSGLFLGLSSVALAAANKSTKHHHIRGTVVDVMREANKNTGTIKVRVHRHHKKRTTIGVAKPARRSHIVTLHVHSKTRFDKVLMHANVALQHTPASFADVHKGAHVHVHVSSKHHQALHVALIKHVKGSPRTNLAKKTPKKTVKAVKPVKPVKKPVKPKPHKR